MAIDLVANPGNGTVTVVHDDQELQVFSLAVGDDGSVSAAVPGGWREIGRLVPSMLADIRSCHRAVVVRMHGTSVAAARAVPFDNGVG